MPCPDNSTECLLRAILDTSATPSIWNPLSFSFTAPIGLLALVFSILTIYQGIVSAGQGRLKATRRTIGPWAAYTQYLPDWKGLRFRATAHVPVLTMSELSKAFEIAVKAVERAERPQYDPKRFAREEKKTSIGALCVYPATWVNLLELLNLHSLHQHLRREVCSADYLPSELQAVPAYASVECLLFLSAAAGCDTLEIRDQYPQASGPTSHLAISIYPYLGPVALFQQSSVIAPKNLKTVYATASSYAQGKFMYKEAVIDPCQFDVKHHGAVFEPLIRRMTGIIKPEIYALMSLLVADSPRTVVVFPHGRMQIQHILTRATQISFSPGRESFGTFINNISRFISGRNGQLIQVTDWDFAQRCEYMSKPFLGASWWGHNGKLKGKLETDDTSRPQWLKLNPPDQLAKQGSPPIAKSLREHDLVILNGTLALCLDWLKDPQSLNNPYDGRTKSFHRLKIQFQLQEVDYWLKQNVGQAASVAISTILPEVYSELFVNQGSHELQERAPSTADSYETLLRNLLIYRATLFGVLLTTYIDNSIVLNTSLGQRVIRFL